jgi:hypothetical protein
MKKRPADRISFLARGHLICSPKRKCLALFFYGTENGLVPGMVEMRAENELVETIPPSRVSIQVELCGVRFRCRAAGYYKNEPIFLLHGAPFFRAFARVITAQSRPRPDFGSARTRRRGVRAKA